jgi:hypothetical protein
VIPYEQQLDANLRWAMEEGDRYFARCSAVHLALREVVRRLDELSIPYAVCGDLAYFFHGYRRFTEIIEILVTRESLTRIHEEMANNGYVPLSAGSKHLRDGEYGVKIKFLVTGEYSGDGRPKPVSYPDPTFASVELDRLRVLSLEKILELKLSSEMTPPWGLQDIADAQSLIRVLNLPETFAERLDPVVRDKYREQWTLLATHPDPFESR